MIASSDEQLRSAMRAVLDWQKGDDGLDWVETDAAAVFVELLDQEFAARAGFEKSIETGTLRRYP